MTTKIDTGDVVQLLSGGPHMTVIRGESVNHSGVEVGWFGINGSDTNKFQSTVVHPLCLKMVKKRADISIEKT